MLVVSIAAVLIGVIALGGAVQLSRALGRARAAAPPPGEAVRRLARRATARVAADEIRPGAVPRPSGVLTHADVVLTSRRLIVATHEGRVLDADSARGLQVRCTGPGRLVIESERPSANGLRRLRLELALPEAELWAREAQELLGAGAS